jgi:DTW domain-containing protein YfiP
VNAPKRPRCSICLRPALLCLCPLVPSLDSTVSVLVIQHPQEQRHALNTGRLLVAGLIQAELLVTERIMPGSAWSTLLSDPSWRTELLFPGLQTSLLMPSSLEDQRPRRLVLLDGTWRKARKILALNPLLQQLPRVCLPDGLVSLYRLRKTDVPNALSTIEAGVQALQQIDPDSDYSLILRPFEALIEGQIQAMGSECFARNHTRSGSKPGSSEPQAR